MLKQKYETELLVCVFVYWKEACGGGGRGCEVKSAPLGVITCDCISGVTFTGEKIGHTHTRTDTSTALFRVRDVIECVYRNVRA